MIPNLLVEELSEVRRKGVGDVVSFQPPGEVHCIHSLVSHLLFLI